MAYAIGVRQPAVTPRSLDASEGMRGARSTRPKLEIEAAKEFACPARRIAPVWLTVIARGE